MADKKITELTEVTSLPDAAFLTAVDTTRATGDQNVKIQKSNVITDPTSGTIEMLAFPLQIIIGHEIF